MRNSAASRLVHEPYSEETVIRTAREALQETGGRVSCAFVFVSADYRPYLQDFLELVQLHGHVPTIVGCSGSGLIGTGEEAEGASGFSLLFLHLPDTQVHAITFDGDLPMEDASPEEWHRFTGVADSDVDAWILLANPAGLQSDEWLDAWNKAYPGKVTLGGVGSGGESVEDIFLFQGRSIVESAVGLGFRGGVRIETVVSQGCRPIGEPLTITGAERNLITSLGSRPSYERLVETIEGLNPLDQGLAAEGNLFAGLAMSEYVDEFKTGDFLVRNILGADPDSGAVAIGGMPRIGQTLQFQLRDRDSAGEELQRLLQLKRKAGVKTFASLLFSCNGRGRGLFGARDHDALAVRDYLGKHPSAGCFCNGEIGPVGGRTFIHGYTASIAIFADV